ncbi:MAG TPA: AAA family ATPase [Geothrix sp.]|jgi:predicted AAA+ superfamily ATPase
MYIARQLDLRAVLQQKSCFLFGPRQTGKSSLIRETLPEVPVYNLLDHRTWLDLNANPSKMREELEATGLRDAVVAIDEIQKLPVLLDEAQLLIETRGLRFLLTGSSARKLKRSGANLLGGRARSRMLHPFSWCELGAEFDLVKALNHGLLPHIYGSEDPGEDLRNYVGTYLREEIAAEGLTRNVPAFARFLEVAAACNGRMLNKTEVANDAKVPRTTVNEYFEILKDTLIGTELEAWTRSQKRKAIETAKFYLFDGGVARAILGLPRLVQKSPDFGDMFEHFIFHELKTWIDTRKPGLSLHYWRSTSGFEVDFILGGHTAIEVKATASTSRRDFRGLEALAEEGQMKRLILVCQEAVPRQVGSVLVLPWAMFLERLWENDFVD